MANVSRKAIAAAILATIAPSGGVFAVSGRRIVNPENVAQPGKPALFLLKANEKITAGAEGMPPERVLHFTAVVYSNVGSGQAGAQQVPADVFDDLLDSITVALATTMPPGSRQTLGLAPAVYDCVIDGTPLFAPGDNQGKGMMMVPIKVTLGQYP